MTDHPENDDLLKRLGAEDPAADATEAAGERERVRSRVREMLGSSDSPKPGRRITPPRLAVAGLILVAALGISLALTRGGSSPGPGAAPALAIEKTPKWVTLTLKDPNASQDEMNQELADAGIDRVRVKSVPGPPKKPPHRFWGHASAGTWAGYVELGPRCQGGVTRFGYDVDIPISHPYDRANRHGAEDLFDLTVPHHSGAVTAEEAGTPFSRSTVRLPTHAIDDPRNAAKVLVAVRPRSAGDTPESNDIGVDQLMDFGGVFAQYGEAIQSGHDSCGDFGLKPFPKPTFPPREGKWTVVHITASKGGARKMTRELRSGGIKGKVRQIPAQREEVGQWLGFARVPPPPAGWHPHGNKLDVVPNDLPHVKGPQANDIALLRSHFRAFPNVRWVFWVGRSPRPGEKAKVVGQDGPTDAAAALRRGCPDLAKSISANGKRKWCSSSLPLQIPVPPQKR